MEKKLRPYQVDAYDAVFKSFEKGCSKMICVLPTGAGKTALAAKIAKRFKKILFMSHTEELINQSGAALIEEFYPEININDIIANYGDLIEYQRYLQNGGMFTKEEREKFGIIKADLFNIDAHVTLASFQTLHRRLDRIPADHFDLIIVDECHLAAATTVVRSINYFKPELLLGLTATPHRMDGMQLGDIFDEIVFQYSILDAINDGFLVEFDAIQIKTQINLDNVHTIGGDFNKKELREAVDTPERNQLILDSYRKYSNGMKNIIFCVDVEHAKNVHQVFTQAGELAEILVGDKEITPDRIGVINRFRSGETTHLINVFIATIGFDDPYVQCICDVAPTKSKTRALQKWGRGTRTLPGVIDGIEDSIERRKAIKASNKPVVRLLDFVDITSKHRVVTTWSLDKDQPIEKRVFTTSEKKAILIEAKKKREFEATKKKDARVNLFEIPKVKYSTSIRMQEEASPRQLEIIKEKGYPVDTIHYTKMMASEIISNLPVSDAQVKWLKWQVSRFGMHMEINATVGLTYGEFQLAKKKIDDLEAKRLAEKNKVVESQQLDIEEEPF